MLPRCATVLFSKRVTAPQAMEHYSRMLRHLLSIVPQLNDSIDDPQNRRAFCCPYTYAGKELADRNGPGGDCFTQGFFDDVTRQRLLTASTGQQACFEIFLSHSSADVQTTISLHCQPDRETEQLRARGLYPQPAADEGLTLWPGLLCKPRALSICARWRRRSSPI